AHAPRAREPVPGRAAGLRAERGGAGRAATPDRRPVRGAVRAGTPADSIRRGCQAGRAVRARRAGGRALGSRRGRLHPRPTAAARGAPLRALPDRRTARSVPSLSRMIDLPVRRLREDAVLPERAYSGDAGLDLAACDRHELPPGERVVVGTGLAFAIPKGFAGFVQPRSGLAARHGISVVNAPGLVDSGYRGEIRVVLLNTDEAEPFVVEPGMRIAQLVVVAVETPDPVEV